LVDGGGGPSKGMRQGSFQHKGNKLRRVHFPGCTAERKEESRHRIRHKQRRKKGEKKKEDYHMEDRLPRPPRY